MERPQSRGRGRGRGVKNQIPSPAPLSTLAPSPFIPFILFCPPPPSPPLPSLLPSVRAQKFMGRICYAIGEVESAIVHYRRSLAISPNQKDVMIAGESDRVAVAGMFRRVCVCTWWGYVCTRALYYRYNPREFCVLYRMLTCICNA